MENRADTDAHFFNLQPESTPDQEYVTCQSLTCSRVTRTTNYTYWTILTLEANSSAGTYYETYDKTFKTSITTNVPSINHLYYVVFYLNNDEMYTDWVYARPMALIEPSISYGSPESSSDSISNITYSNFNLLTFYANDTGGNLAMDSVNFSWNYYVYEELDERTFDATVYETDEITYYFNGTYNDNFNLNNVTFRYDGINYTANSDTDGSGITANYTLDIPTVTGQSNKNFTWVFSVSDITAIANDSEQTINDIQFMQCNGTGLIYLNVTFKDELSLSYINHSISDFDMDYYLGSGTNNISYNYMNVSTIRSFPFCFTPQDRTLYISDLEIQYVNSAEVPQYFARNVYFSNKTLTNSTTELILYNLQASQGSYTSFYITDLNGNVLSDVEITLTRNIEGFPYTMREISDASGIATFWVNPNEFYSVILEKTGCTTDSFSLRPTQASYGFTLDCGGGGGGGTGDANYTIPYVSYPATVFDGLTYYKSPLTGVTTQGNYTFKYRVDSEYYDIEGIKFILIKNDDPSTMTNATTNTSDANCTARTCYVELDYELYNNDIVRGSYYVDFGEGYLALEYDGMWIVTIQTNTSYRNFRSGLIDFRDIFNITVETDSGDIVDAENRAEFTRIVFVFLIMTIMFAFFNRISGYDSSNPGAFLLIMSIVILLGSAVGGLTGEGIFYIKMVSESSAGPEIYSTAQSGMAHLVNNYIIAMNMALVTIGYWFSVSRRQT